MVINISECPYCGGYEFIKAKQSGYADITGEGVLNTAPLYHQICRKCGSVVRSYVENPEQLLKRRNRK